MSLTRDIQALIVKHDREGISTNDSIALRVLNNFAMLLDDSPDDDSGALAEYLLKEWGDHPAWVIDETCPNGKSAGELAIAILDACKAEIADAGPGWQFFTDDNLPEDHDFVELLATNATKPRYQGLYADRPQNTSYVRWRHWVPDLPEQNNEHVIINDPNAPRR